MEKVRVAAGRTGTSRGLEPTIILFALADSQLWSNADFKNWATDNGEKDLVIRLEGDDPLAVFRARLVHGGLASRPAFGETSRPVRAQLSHVW